MACARLLVDVDRRIAHISTQVAMGADKDEVVSEQYHALLAVFPMLHGVGLDAISRISSHLVAQDVFSRPQSELLLPHVGISPPAGKCNPTKHSNIACCSRIGTGWKNLGSSRNWEEINWKRFWQSRCID